MSLKYLLDTNVISERARPKPNGRVLAGFHRHEYEIATAAPVLHELRFGCLMLPPSRKRSDLKAYLEEVILPVLSILPYDLAAAEWHASERARLTRAGKTPPFVDGQIAAIAYVNDLELVTMNLQDFEPFEDLRVTDWRM